MDRTYGGDTRPQCVARPGGRPVRGQRRVLVLVRVAEREHDRQMGMAGDQPREQPPAGQVVRVARGAAGDLRDRAVRRGLDRRAALYLAGRRVAHVGVREPHNASSGGADSPRPPRLLRTWHAIWRPSTVARCCSVSRQLPWATGQRGWNRQPVGGFAGSGTSPGRSTGRTPAPALLASGGRPPAPPDSGSRGIAPTRASVYGWRGFAHTVSVSPVSTIRPRYMTATRSATWRTTARSCDTRIRPRPSSSTRSLSRLAICACADASSALIGSSAIRQDGLVASVLAIAIRCRWPPLNSCG